MSSILFNLKNVYKSITLSNKNEINILCNININFLGNGLYFILGKSGCGKTTLLNLLSSFLKPTKGSILYKNKNLYEFNEKELIDFRKKEIGVLFQNINLIYGLSSYENLLIAANIKNVANTKIKEYLDKFNLNYLSKMLVDNLSGGEKQRIAFIRAILNEPHVLLCDEPTGALDAKNSKILIDLLRDYAKDHLVIVVTHNDSLIDFDKDKVIILKDGRITNEIKKE